MGRSQKMLKSFKNYLDIISSLDYEELRDCINSDVVWDDGRTRRNPTAYEIFATHEHLDFAKEDIFKFSGIILDLDAFEASAKKVEEIWQARLPKLFPGHEFIIYKDKDLRQVAFCRKRTGVTDNPDEIISCLAHEHHNIRWNALFSAMVFPHPKLVPHLLERLDDDDIYNVLKAIIALGASGDEKVIDILKKRFLILETGPEGKKYINDFFAYDLFSTMIKLGDKGFKSVFDLFTNYRDLDIHTLEHLCELMGKTGKSECLDILMEIYFSHPEAGEPALTGLLSMQRAALPRIIPFLKDKSPDIRKKAIGFIANCFIKDARKYLLEGLRDRNSLVREAAVHGIGRFYHSTREQVLLDTLNDRANNVRIRAVEALGNLFEPKLLPRFEVLCLDKNPRVRHEAMRAVASLDSKEGLNFLFELYDQVQRPDKIRIIDSLYAYTGEYSLLRPIIAKALAEGDKRIAREVNDLLELI